MIELLAAALSGLLIGSFLNVCIYRLPRDLSVVKPRSHCPACLKTISWYDNIPIVSFFVLGRKCRHCAEPIDWRYPAVEAATAALFAWAIYSHGWTLEGFKLCLYAAILIDLIATDWEERILPDEFTLGGAFLGVVIAPFAPPPSNLMGLFLPRDVPEWSRPLMEALSGALLCAGALWLTGALYKRVRNREGLGLGDVKMLLFVGAFLGLPCALLTVFFGSMVGSVIGGLYILLTKKDSTYELPFGSFLGVAALIAGMFGESFLRWYGGLGR
ncbi:MAG: prepilin peptidase [Candidatus Solibacter usitatus]|nr:prepilin peptidase [Candidatus Solibacter usitatus]